MKGTSSMQCNLEDCYFSWTFFSDVFQVSGEPQSSLHPRDGRHRKDAAQARRPKEVGAGMYVTGRLPCNFQAESKSREPQTLLSLLIRVITIPQLCLRASARLLSIRKMSPLTSQILVDYGRRHYGYGVKELMLEYMAQSFIIAIQPSLEESYVLLLQTHYIQRGT